MKQHLLRPKMLKILADRGAQDFDVLIMQQFERNYWDALSSKKVNFVLERDNFCTFFKSSEITPLITDKIWNILSTFVNTLQMLEYLKRNES